LRTYDELLAAAIATGTFENYVGDGYSVPWEVALPLSLPAGFTLWSYKAFLDANWPAGAKLHDWLYTPYGTLINATRDESDLALYEYIARYSPFHAAIVYAACHVGGEPYFGVSQTGYNGLQSSAPLRNIESSSLDILGVTEMSTKVVMLINGTTVRSGPMPDIGFTGTEHQFGCSESFWSDLTIGNALRVKLLDLAVKRAILLPAECSIVAFRLYNDGTGASQTVPVGQSGIGGTLNTPYDSLLLSTRANGTATQRKFWLHCVPDGQITQGEFRPTSTYAGFLATYLGSAGLGGIGNWIAETRSLYTRIQTIASDGTINFEANNPFAVEQFITISRAYNRSQQRFYSGRFHVQAAGPGLTQCKVTGWPQIATTGGAAWIPTKTSVSFLNGAGLYAERSGSRRVGRPFLLYRGRVSKRRPIQ
jgi:hypothetical protein